MVSPDDKNKSEQATTIWRPGASDVAPKISSIAAGDTHSNAPAGTKPPGQHAPPDSPATAGDASLPQIPGYELLARVASGGMGVVYRARDLALDRIVALKVPRFSFVGSAEDKERFLREARASARLRHPNICPIYEVKEVAEQPYLSMAFIEGATLRDWALESKPGPRQIAELMAALATAVQFAHDQKVVHRDLKPSNVMVEAHNSQPLLMDFGLAKDLRQEEGLTASGDVLGTPAYMAPEQAAGRVHEIGPLSDVYSLGAILYELLGGSPPFKGTVGELLVQVQREEPRSLRKINPQVHTDLETICQKAMAKVPAERYASAAELAADLERFARGDAILAKRQLWLRRVWRQAAQNRLAAALVVGLVVVLLAGAGMLALVPAVSKSLTVLRLSQELERNLAANEWHPQQVPVSLALIDRLRQVSPADAELAQAAVARRLSEFIKTGTNQKLANEDVQQLESHIAILDGFDSKLADERRAALDAKLGKWQRIATLHTPFANAKELLPGVRVSENGAALLGPAEGRADVVTSVGTMLSPSLDSGNFHLEGKLVLPLHSQAAFVISANQRHELPVTALAVSPDGETFVSADSSGASIRWMRASDGQLLEMLPGHGGAISSLVFSPDGKWLASASWDGEVHVISVETKQVAKTLAIDVPLQLIRGQAMFFGPSIAFSREGDELLATCGDGVQAGELRRWKMPSVEPLPALRPKKPTPHLLHVATATNSDRIAATTSDNRVLLWELAGGEPAVDIELLPVTQGPDIAAMALQPTGNLVACAAQGVILLVDPKGQVKGSLQGYAAGCYSLRFDPTGNTIAGGYESGAVKIWDLSSRAIKISIPDYRRRCLALDFSPAGNFLLGGVEYGTIHLWETATGQERYQLDGLGYRFVINRSEDRRLTLRIERGVMVLREQTLDLGSGVISLSGRRTGELLELQVNQLKPLLFRDYFPQRPIVQGRWGVQLTTGAELSELVVRRAIDALQGSPLEQGDTFLQRGEYAEAWEQFEQQLAVDDGNVASHLRLEAALKSALCLRHLGRNAEAIERLREVSLGDPTLPAVIMARFQLWELLIQQQKLKEADALFETIRASHSTNQVAEVIPETWRTQMTIAYAQPLLHRSGMVSPGSLARMKTLLSMAEFNQLDLIETLEWQVHIIAAYRLNEDWEEARTQSNLLLAQLEAELLAADLRRRTATYLWIQLELYGFLCRQRGEPQRPEALINAAIYDAQTDQLWPEMQGDRLILLLEKARLQAALGQWNEVTQTLQPIMTLQSTDNTVRSARANAALLLGFAYRHLGNEQQAVAAWKQHPFPSVPEGGRMDGFLGEDLIQWWILRSLAGDLTADEATNAYAALKLRIGGTSSLVGQLMGQVNVGPQTIQKAWQSGPGTKLAEEFALGNRMSREELALAVQVGALAAFQQGAFDDNWSAEQAAATWALVQRAFLAYSRDEFSIIALPQLAAAWKGVAPFLGWRSLLVQLPKDVQASTAYVLGMRYAKRGSREDAKQLWQLAKDLAPGDAALAALADAALAQP